MYLSEVNSEKELKLKEIPLVESDKLTEVDNIIEDRLSEVKPKKGCLYD